MTNLELEITGKHMILWAPSTLEELRCTRFSDIAHLHKLIVKFHRLHFSFDSNCQFYIDTPNLYIDTPNCVNYGFEFVCCYILHLWSCAHLSSFPQPVLHHIYYTLAFSLDLRCESGMCACHMHVCARARACVWLDLQKSALFAQL